MWKNRVQGLKQIVRIAVCMKQGEPRNREKNYSFCASLFHFYFVFFHFPIISDENPLFTILLQKKYENKPWIFFWKTKKKSYVFVPLYIYKFNNQAQRFCFNQIY